MNQPSLTAQESPFDRAFWCTYLSNTLLMIASSMLFRYADLIVVLGGNELHLGWIVGIGAIGSILMRVLQGVAIDRFGAGRIWLLSMTCLVVSLISHLWIDRIGPSLLFCRIAYAASLAACFAGSITFVSIRAPAGRTAEMIGLLGSSGFVGMAIGPVIADYLLSGQEIARVNVGNLFLYAAAISSCSFFAAAFAVLWSRPVVLLDRKFPPAWWLIRRYQPGRVLLIGFSMGLGIGIPFTFVRTYAQSIDVDHIRNYFLMYAMTAFVVRIRTRTLPDQWGVRPTIILGVALLCCSISSLVLARDESTLLIPGCLGGMAHAFVFPAAVTGCSLSFPFRYRGLATTIMLGMFDLGALLGPPAVGTLWYLANHFQLPAYPMVFATIACFLASSAVYYVLEPKGRRTNRAIKTEQHERIEKPAERIDSRSAQTRCDASLSN